MEITRTSQYAFAFLNRHRRGAVHSVYKKTINLEIDGKKQTLNFDDAGHFYTFSSKKPVTAKQVKLIIDSVYQGSKWQDTCISEVEFYGIR